MSTIKIESARCTLCEVCLGVCPFNAMSRIEDKIIVNSACKLCKICIKNCPVGAISLEEAHRLMVNKNNYKGIAVFAENRQGILAPVVKELLGKARTLAEVIDHPVIAIVIGASTEEVVNQCLHLGADKVIVAEDVELTEFRADIYTDVLVSILERLKPSVVLVGATPVGRSLAPKAAVRMDTGLTADCTQLEMKENTDLVQIRPAFGGNIMAQIITTYTRPQFATVRYKVFDAAVWISDPKGTVERVELNLNEHSSSIRILDAEPLKHQELLSEAERIIVAGVGVNNPKGLSYVNELASLLDASIAYTRPMVEKGISTYQYQIGLSGRTVKPKLIITCGVSGAVQFAAGMQNSDRIIAINNDPDADIFKIAHVAIVGDCAQVLPKLIDQLRKGDTHVL